MDSATLRLKGVLRRQSTKRHVIFSKLLLISREGHCSRSKLKNAESIEVKVINTASKLISTGSLNLF